MRKKDLYKLYEQAYEKINKLTVELEEIRVENFSLKKKIADLNEICERYSKHTTKKVDENWIENTKRITKVSDMVELGSKSIGKVVLSSVRYCNSLTVDNENVDVKELINLILGRTEVAKAEILKIISADDDIEIKKELLSKEEVSAEDYFKSVLGQIEV